MAEARIRNIPDDVWDKLKVIEIKLSRKAGIRPSVNRLVVEIIKEWEQENKRLL